MYKISNQQREEILYLLSTIKAPPDAENKQKNIARRAGLIIRKLSKIKKEENGNS